MAKEYPNVDLKTYNSDEQSRINELEEMFQASKDARKASVARWRRNEELYDGKFLKPFNLPKYKTRIEPNIVHSVLETMYSILTDRPPKVDCMPKREDQVESAYKAQETLEWIMSDKKAQRAVAHMKRDGLTYGNGFLKIAVVDGDISFSNPSPFSVFVDPLSTSMADVQCVTFATPTYVDDIKTKYGKQVRPEGKLNEYRSFIKADGKYATDKAPELNELSPNPSSDGLDTGYKGGMAILKESWYYKDGELRLSTWAGRTLLLDVKSPYDFIPLVVFKNYPSAHNFYGKGEPEVIESLAVGSSIALSQGMDNLILQGNPVVIMSKSLAKIPGNRLSDKPGNVLYINNPSERIDRLPAGNISSSTLPLAESMIQLADTVSGVHDITQGRNPSGVTASRAIQQLQEASQQVIRAKEREIGTDAIIDMYKIVLSLIVGNYAKTINIRKYNQDGSGYSFEVVQPYDLDADLDFKYVPGSSMPESRASRMDQAIDLLQLGLLDQESFWLWTQRDITREKLEQINQMKKAQQEQIQKEIDVMSQSTDEDEIADALLRHRELTGGIQDEEELSSSPSGNTR